MKITSVLIEQLKEDANLRLQVAIALGVGERNVLELAKRESDNLTKYGAIVVFMKYGYTIEEIIVHE